MRTRLFAFLIGIALVGAAAWLASPRAAPREDARLVPARVVLHPGERTEVRLLMERGGIAALRFRLRFDPAVVAVEGLGPQGRTIAAGGRVIALPPHRGPGWIEVPGLAMTGGRTLPAGRAVYRVTLRGLAPGTSELAVEHLTVVDLASQQETVPALSARLRVRPR